MAAGDNKVDLRFDDSALKRAKRDAEDVSRESKEASSELDQAANKTSQIRAPQGNRRGILGRGPDPLAGFREVSGASALGGTALGQAENARNLVELIKSGSPGAIAALAVAVAEQVLGTVQEFLEQEFEKERRRFEARVDLRIQRALQQSDFSGRLENDPEFAKEQARIAFNEQTQEDRARANGGWVQGGGLSGVDEL